MSTFEFPTFPEVPSEQRASGKAIVRYEDVSQDGFLKVCGIPHVLGSLFYRSGWHEHPVNQACRAQKILPILSRLTLQGAQGPISVRRSVRAEGGFSLGTQRDSEGEVERLMLDMDARLCAPRARTHDPQPQGAGELIEVGRVHAEHVFTRPFGPPESRKVERIELEGRSAVPDQPVVSLSAPALLEMPGGVEWVEEDYALDPVPHCFGLVHTDSNQHVNSLVYPLLFEEAMVRRLAALGADTSTALLEMIDLGFRKPCFAGDRVQLWLRCFRQDGRWAAIGYLAPEGVGPARAHTTCRMRMR